MSQKHFISIAAAMLATRPQLSDGHPAAVRQALRKQWVLSIGALADTLAETNARFDRARFLAACGM